MPTFLVSLAAVAGLQANIPVAIVVALLGALGVGSFAEYRLARIIASIGKIARGDRYTSLPNVVGDGSIQHFAATAETIRSALIEADTLAVDQRRRETEARLHHAGRLFFTGNFRQAVEEVVNTFTSAGERIRGTAADLAQSNRLMAHQVRQASDAASRAAEDVAGVAALHERNLIGHMVAWTYLHTLDTPENETFIDEWRQFTGDPAAMTNDAMEASWIGFQLWSQSVAAAGTTEVAAVRKALAGRSIRAPSGFGVVLDAANQHLHKPGIIGRMDEKNVIWPVWISDKLIAPEPWSQWLPKNADRATLKRAG